MKRTLSVFLVLLTLLGCIVPCAPLTATAAGLVTPDRFGGVNNVMLMYTFANQGAVSGRHTVDTLLPYVGYYGTDGKLKDTFYDSFLILPCVSTGPSGGTMYLSSNPAIASDWQAYVDDVFAGGYNLDALNTAVGKVKKELGLGNYKAKVFFTLIYPREGQTNFGTLGGRKYDFTSLQDRIDVCKWQVDNYISLFKKGGYENLELFGFYWFEEFIKTNSSNEKTLLTSATSYIRDKGYKSVWIPYYMAQGWNRWKEYGFDIACLQPNYMFNANAESDRIKNAVNYARQNDMCNEMEISASVLSSADYYNRYLTYLRDFAATGAMKAVKMYYQDVRFYYECYRSSIPEVRLLYDLTYKYAKGTLKDSDFDGKYIETSGVSKDYSIVSLGCDYTATKAYTDSTSGYADIDGKELTDGVYYKTNYGTEWHAFHRGTTESDGNHQITVDLGSNYTNLKYIFLEFRLDEPASIGLPAKVDFYVSSDGKEFSLLKTTVPEGAVIGCPAAVYEGKEFSARYVKAVFPKSDKAFVFVSELAVGCDKIEINLSEEQEMISKGCKYEAFTPFTDLTEWDAPYKHIDGKELTDGILGSSDVGTEWHDMYTGYLEEGEKFFATIDLGKKRDDIGYFALQFQHDLSYGIAKPDNVTFLVSDDGKRFTEAGTVAVLLGTDGYGYAVFKSELPISGRYVKAEFLPGQCVHHFVSEFIVATAGKAEIGEHIKGDVNLSGKFELADYLYVLRLLEKSVVVSPTAYAAADVNGDGSITSADADAIKKLFTK